MSSATHLAPSPPHADPFATPQLSERNSYDGQDRAFANWGPDSHNLQPMEMADRSAPQFGALAPQSKPSFMQRWKSADQRLYMATVGKMGSGGRGTGEKQLAATAATRRRRPALCCTILLGLLALIIIIVIVVPIAVVLGSRNRSSSSNSSSSSGPGGMDPLPQNSGIVTVQNGQYQGTNMANGISSYLGLPYAAPPTGNLRFAAPQQPANFTGIKAATKYGAGCHRLGTFTSAESEDCLYLDIYAPTNATQNSKLPVYVFIQGGGLQEAAIHYNGSNLITASGLQIITVTFTYRVNAFGFLASKEIQNSASATLNVGFKDQRQVLQWVQKNIQAFGGDPSHVVLGGESGGAGSVVQQLSAYGGRDDKLYQAAIMQSQSVQPVRDVGSSQFQYDYIVGNTTCSGASDTLSCLRGLPVQDLVNAITNSPFPNGAGGNPVFPYNPVIDNDMIREYPIDAFHNGHFVNVPMIFGDDTDEGTIFVNKKTILTQTDSENYLRNTFPKINSTMLNRYDSFYNFSDTGADNYWQNVARAYGETRYICPGIQLSNYASANNSGKVWNFRYDVEDPASEAAGTGVKHGSEMTSIFGVSPDSPQSYQANGENVNVIPLMQGYWTSFIKHYDPNTEKMHGAPTWVAWSNNNRIHILTNETAMEQVDSAQADRCAYLNSIATAIGQ